MTTEILKLLENDARHTPEEIAVMLGCEVNDVKKAVSELEKDGTILGYKTIIDWEKTEQESVCAIIEVKLTPQRDCGFDRVAEKIYNYPEVQSVYLMSGAYDLLVLIEGKTMKEVALFVSQKLATIDEVTATATHFVLHKYKDKGVLYEKPQIDERGTFN